MSQTNGRFIWHEVLTTDTDATKAFYSEVIGWKTQAFDDSGEYTLWLAGQQPIGGFMALPEEAKKQGAPPHWLGHVRVDDVAAATAKIKELGGKIYHSETIPNVGEFAVAADPQGAVFSVFKPENETPVGDSKAVGQVSWNELNTTDYEAAWKFYGELFGWKETESMEMPDNMGTYLMFTNTDEADDEATDGKSSLGGMSSVAKVQGFPPHWMYYINVENIDAAVERIKKNGGKIMNGPMEVPGGSKVAQCTDPQGIAFGIHAENSR